MSRARKRRGGDLTPRRRKSKRAAEAIMMNRFFLIALLAVTATAARITPSDRTKAVTVSDPQISPDGKSIVCVVSRVNLKEDRHDTELTSIDVASGTPRPLTF